MVLIFQMLWMFPKLRHLGCGCYPWYFYQRYIEDEEDSKYEPNIKWRLIQDWTEVMPYEYNFNFTGGCFVFLLPGCEEFKTFFR